MSTTTPSSAPTLINLTPKAIAHVKSLLERQGKPEAYLRVAAVGGGCSGFSYKLDVADEATAQDRVMTFDGLKVLLDMKSSLLLSGLELDYNDDLMNAGFTFQNPNAAHTCGCGTSFSV
jgi:iron-sulfur cluster assembly accessory protein